MLIVAVFVFWIGAISVRLVHLQVNQHDKLHKQALGQRRDLQKTKMLRGTIYDRSERTLAMSIKVNSLYADPLEIDDINSTAERLSKVLKMRKRGLVKKITRAKKKGRRFVWLKRKVDQAKYEKVNKTLSDEDIKKYDFPKVKGLHWTKEQKREYPYKSLAAHIIGFSNFDDEGQAGVEFSQEKLLRGEVVKTWRKRDRLGRVYDESNTGLEKPKDIVLTISNSIQYKVEEALARGVKRVRGKSGKAVVLDPKTGEILAMANFPSFNPNKFRKLKPAMWKNRVIQDNYSPGSIFKLITYGAALEEDLIKPESQIDCGDGRITVSKHTFNDSHPVGKVSYAKAFAESSNVCAIKTGMRVGRNRFYRYARSFGFGKKTGIKLPAETRGLLRSPKTWNGDSLASMSIGYEIGVTALQSATAFATIANDGIKIQPHIVKEIRQANGKTVSTTEPEKVRVVSAKTANDLRKMLRQVVLEGTGRRAQLNGYTSAGKTGTAWKYDSKLKAFNRNKYVSSFIGFAPADDPAVVIAIVVDEPRGAMRYGGQVAAPIFREIAEKVLPELNITPDGTLPEDFKPGKNKNKKTPSNKEKKSQDKKDEADEILASNERKPKAGKGKIKTDKKYPKRSSQMPKHIRAARKKPKETNKSKRHRSKRET